MLQLAMAAPVVDDEPAVAAEVDENRLATSIDLKVGTYDVALALEVALFFGLGERRRGHRFAASPMALGWRLPYATSGMVAPVRNRSEALARLADLAPHLLSRSVISLRVFGSAGRDALTDESDVDILVEFDRPVGAFEFLDLQAELARMLGRPVDLVTPAAIKERMRARIEREAVDAV